MFMLTLYLAACQTPESVTTIFKCSWGWMQIASETCRVLLQSLINILPICITLVLYIYSNIAYLVYLKCEESNHYSSSNCQLWTNSNKVIKIMLNCRPNGRRPLGRPLKGRLDEAETGLSGPNWWLMIWYDIFVNCNWVVTRWQQYSTHLHTNNT
jgi:hypothetical protein